MPKYKVFQRMTETIELEAANPYEALQACINAKLEQFSTVECDRQVCSLDDRGLTVDVWTDDTLEYTQAAGSDNPDDAEIESWRAAYEAKGASPS